MLSIARINPEPACPWIEQKAANVSGPLVLGDPLTFAIVHFCEKGPLKLPGFTCAARNSALDIRI